MAHHNRNNQYRYPHRNIYRSNRLNQHINQLPNTPEEGHSQTETYTSQNAGNNKWSRADKIAVWAVSVNIVLALFTGLLFNLTRESNKNAERSAKAAVTADSIANASLDESKANNAIGNQRQKEADKSADIINRKRDKKDSQAFALQINEFNEAKNRFEIENRPYLEIAEINKSVQYDTPIDVHFKINNIGHGIADILQIRSCVTTYDAQHKHIDYKNLPINILLPNNSNFTVDSQEKVKSSNAVIDSIRRGEKNIFLIGECDYIDPIKKKTFTYRFDIKMDGDKQAIKVIYSTVQ